MWWSSIVLRIWRRLDATRYRARSFYSITNTIARWQRVALAEQPMAKRSPTDLAGPSPPRGLVQLLRWFDLQEPRRIGWRTPAQWATRMELKRYRRRQFHLKMLTRWLILL